MITFSAILLPKHACKDANESDYSRAEIPIELVDEDLIEAVKEEFLEGIFGTESKMARTSFLKKMQSEKSNWILDSEKIRQKVKQYVRARNQGSHWLDQMQETPTKDSNPADSEATPPTRKPSSS